MTTRRAIKKRVVTDLQECEVAGKVVLVRVDYNVRGKDGRIASTKRIERSVPTLRRLIERKARVVLLSHCGRPFEQIEHLVEEEEQDPAEARRQVRACLSMDAVAVALKSELARAGMSAPLQFLPACSGDAVGTAVGEAKGGSIALLQNVRFPESSEKPGKSRDEQGEPAFAQEMVAAVRPAVYVIDGFSVCHRDHASVTGIARAAV